MGFLWFSKVWYGFLWFSMFCYTVFYRFLWFSLVFYAFLKEKNYDPGCLHRTSICFVGIVILALSGESWYVLLMASLTEVLRCVKCSCSVVAVELGFA